MQPTLIFLILHILYEIISLCKYMKADYSKESQKPIQEHKHVNISEMNGYIPRNTYSKRTIPKTAGKHLLSKLSEIQSSIIAPNESFTLSTITPSTMEISNKAIVENLAFEEHNVTPNLYSPSSAVQNQHYDFNYLNNFNNNNNNNNNDNNNNSQIFDMSSNVPNVVSFPLSPIPDFTYLSDISSNNILMDHSDTECNNNNDMPFTHADSINSSINNTPSSLNIMSSSINTIPSPMNTTPITISSLSAVNEEIPKMNQNKAPPASVFGKFLRKAAASRLPPGIAGSCAYMRQRKQR